MSSESKSLLIELGTEELPPKNLQKLSSAFSAGMMKELKDAGLITDSKFRSFASPRRLAILVDHVKSKQEDRQMERVGPPVKAATDADGAPTKVGLGFARSVGVEFAELGTKETGRGPCLYYSSVQKGEAIGDLLGGMIQSSLDKLPIARRMRWGDRREQFVRPVHWLLTMMGQEALHVEAMGLKSDRVTYGHRIHAEGPLALQDCHAYEETLESQGFVVPCFKKRRERVLTEVEQAAKAKGTPELDRELVDEVTGLVEWPLGLMGSFDQDFLKVPQECLISSMKEHQKYFPVLDAQGKLQPFFVLVTNLKSENPDVIVKGNEKVIAPRLKDAAFFYETDQKRGLGQFQEALKAVVFQKELGTVHEKCQRISEIASYLAADLKVEEAVCRKGGALCKADLASDMVFEFPELQGIMGRYYALAEGEDPVLADAIMDHYRPRFAGDDLPESGVGTALALADKLDTIVGLFGIGKPPTGSKDPYSLRRSALGVLRLLIENKLDLDLRALITKAASLYQGLKNEKAVDEALAFVMGRLPAKYKEEQRNQDSVAAVSALSIDSPFDFDGRLAAVEAFRQMPEAESLALANKRVKNILKDQDVGELAKAKLSDGPREPAEAGLQEAISQKETQIQPLLKDRNYTEALRELAQLKEPIDRFFDEVKVMDDDAAVRQNRLVLLHRLSGLFLQVADISRLQS